MDNSGEPLLLQIAYIHNCVEVSYLWVFEGMDADFVRADVNHWLHKIS